MRDDRCSARVCRFGSQDCVVNQPSCLHVSAANILDAQAEVERRRGNTDVARGLAKRAKRKHDKLKDSLGSANSTYIRAWIEYDGGDVKRASSLLDVAENEYVRLGIKLELTNVRGLRLKIDAAFNPPTP